MTDCFFTMHTSTSSIDDIRQSFVAKGHRLSCVIQECKQPFIIPIARGDPDAFGSAMAISAYIKFVNPNAEITIYYCQVTRGNLQNDILMRHMADLMPQEIKQLTPEKLASSHVVLVDSCSIHDQAFPDFMRGKFRPVVVIDHHNSDEDLISRDNEFYFIKKVGACSTLMSLLCLFGLENFLSQATDVATMLLIGIHNDTKGLRNAEHLDRIALTLLSAETDERLYDEYMNVEFPPEYFEWLRISIEKSEIKEGRLVTGVRNVPLAARDYLPIIAEQLATMKGIILVFLWGYMEDGNVRITARAKNIGRLERLLRTEFPLESGSKTQPSGNTLGGGIIRLNTHEWEKKRFKNPAVLAAHMDYLQQYFKSLIFESTAFDEDSAD